jgi:hypothetical protein
MVDQVRFDDVEACLPSSDGARSPADTKSSTSVTGLVSGHPSHRCVQSGIEADLVAG